MAGAGIDWWSPCFKGAAPAWLIPQCCSWEVISPLACGWLLQPSMVHMLWLCVYDVSVWQIKSGRLANLLGFMHYMNGSYSPFARWWACHLQKQVLGQEHKSVKVYTIASCVAKQWQQVVLDCSAGADVQPLQWGLIILMTLCRTTQQNLHHVDSHRRFTTDVGVTDTTGHLGVQSQEILMDLSSHYRSDSVHSWVPLVLG